MNGKQGRPAEPKTFGKLLMLYRQRAAISQSKLAERADFDHSYVSRLETCVRMPTRDAVDRLSDGLGLDDDDKARLLTAAGFLPVDFRGILPDALQRLYGLYATTDPYTQKDIDHALGMLSDAVEYRRNKHTA